MAALAAALVLTFSGVGAQGADMGFGGNMKTPNLEVRGHFSGAGGAPDQPHTDSSQS